MATTHPDSTQETKPRLALRSDWRVRTGILLILIGGVILIDSFLKTGWLSLMILPVLGLLFLAGGLRVQQWGWMVAGSIFTSLGVGIFLALSPFFRLSGIERMGWLLLAFGCGWLLITLLSRLFGAPVAWWALIPGSALASGGAVLLFSRLRLLDFILYIGLGLGLAFLLWGLASRLFGLIIPGSLLVGLAPGVYLGWATPGELNPLARTGVMLVGFALGWGLVTFFSRRVTPRFLWWPLIPAGVLAMTGWGLYIGGDPHNALSFIGNTGSLALILLGVYLLLMRRGIHG